MPAASRDPHADQREEMVRAQIERRGIRDRRVLDAMRATPRHLFIPEELVLCGGEEVPVDTVPPAERTRRRGTGTRPRDRAYADCALPIGWDQTISQPYIVAFMTEALSTRPSDIVLEVGTGSGYQAAVLGALVEWVYTIEIVEPLARRAWATLEELGISNVTGRAGDAHAGWQEHAPYDAIIVTCAPPVAPPALADQLREGGRMVIPTGPPGGRQTLQLIEKGPNDVLETALLPVAFVPMTGGGRRPT